MVLIRSLSRAEVRSLDVQAVQEFGLPTLCLMENAGRGAAEVLRRRAGDEPKRVTVVAGRGSNGADGAVLARHLDCRGWRVRLIWTSAPGSFTGDAAIQHNVIEKSGIPMIHDNQESDPSDYLQETDWIVDGLLGTGLTRPVEGRLFDWISKINEAPCPILALDMPSGLDCDTGLPLGIAVQATVTASFVARKKGFDTEGSAAWTGAVEVVEIGLPRAALRPFLQG